MSKDKLKLDQRRFVMVYNDFLESDKLDCYEKLVFIIIKKFADYDTRQAFPSLKRIAKIAQVSRSTVQRCIDHLQELGALTVEHRTDEEDGRYTSNLYTLHDYAWMWKDGVDPDDQAELEEDARAIERLRARGYIIETPPNDQGKEKVPCMNENADQSTVQQDTKDTISSNENDSQTVPVRQDQNEDFTLDGIRSRFNYDDLVEEHPDDKAIIDVAMTAIHEIYSRPKGEMRVARVHTPVAEIREHYDQLSSDDILYAVGQYKDQRERNQKTGKKITQTRAYLRTLLFYAKEQRALEETNRKIDEAAQKGGFSRFGNKQPEGTYNGMTIDEFEGRINGERADDDRNDEKRLE